MAALFLLGFLLPLSAALRPRRGAVLPEAARAGRAGILTAVALVPLGLLLAQVAPPHTTLLAGGAANVRAALHCLGTGLLLSLPPFVIAALALRRLVLTGALRAGIALGAAGGALSGLVLHAICPVGGALHAGLAHGGSAAVGAALGALLARLLLSGGRR
jgi:hypothetical protein